MFPFYVHHLSKTHHAVADESMEYFFQSTKMSAVCGVTLCMVLLVAVFHYGQGCGRKNKKVHHAEDCNPKLWDASPRTCHDELFVKRDVANLAEKGEMFLLSFTLP